MVDLGMPESVPWSTARGVNASDQVFGDAALCGVGGDLFLWEHGSWDQPVSAVPSVSTHRS